MIGNIIGNAVRYTPSGGRIDIGMSCTPDAVTITIADTGIGIPPERMADLFGLFTQGDRTSDRNSSGLGLGLALVQKLVAPHGGAVSAFSAGEGPGSVFWICGLSFLISASNGIDVAYPCACHDAWSEHAYPHLS
ncbi:sensor histidine kinase [Massilia sp. RP-1-19]|uniref:histidine kinase n=1 Tax=Massilia polaris TaxID=2728846 RepID=A0A848HIW3_9BURK|nr:sensor histidine kinase [Massilia polaris]